MSGIGPVFSRLVGRGPDHLNSRLTWTEGSTGNMVSPVWALLCVTDVLLAPGTLGSLSSLSRQIHSSRPSITRASPHHAPRIYRRIDDAIVRIPNVQRLQESTDFLRHQDSQDHGWRSKSHLTQDRRRADTGGGPRYTWCHT